MATEKEILNLFDSLWFENLIFMNEQQIHVKEEEDDDDEEEVVFLLEESKKLARMATSLHVRSLSCDQILSSDSISFSSDSESPNSFLFAAPKLQTILSGKEVIEFEDQLPAAAAAEAKRGERMEVTIEERESCSVNKDMKRRRRRERRRIYGCGGGCSSKSLSDLEFEELKGFMDLGFVFSEEDKEDSSLVSIIPGLQRLGRKKGSSVGEDHDSSYENDHHHHHHEAAAAEAAIDDYDDDDKSVVEVCRPYLSEAWDVMDDDDDDEDERENEENALNAALVNWRIPAVVNDIDMKDQLRFWAQSVASAVR